jgi:hypothetical protein
MYVIKPYISQGWHTHTHTHTHARTHARAHTHTHTHTHIGSGCGRVVEDAGRKAKRMVLQRINGVGSNPVKGRTKN